MNFGPADDHGFGLIGAGGGKGAGYGNEPPPVDAYVRSRLVALFRLATVKPDVPSGFAKSRY